MASDNVEKAISFLRGLASGDADLTTSHVSPKSFIQHDPSMADGIDGLRGKIDWRQQSDGRLELARVLEDDAFVVIHGRDGAGDGEVFFAVFRFNDGLLVEFWRFSAPAAPANASGHTQTDGPTQPKADQDTDRTKALVRDYYETVHVAGRHDRIGHYMSDDRQIRHEPGVRDGGAAFERDLAVLTRSRTIDEIVLLVGQGDFVFIAARGTHEGNPCAYLDLYRVEANMLVEHWGFPQEIPPIDQGKNHNGAL